MVGVLQQLGESETALAMLEEKVPITEDNALEYHKRKAQLRTWDAARGRGAF